MLAQLWGGVRMQYCMLDVFLPITVLCFKVHAILIDFGVLD